MRVLVTGGAGFIGSHVCDELLGAGHEVVALDSLIDRVHPSGERPEYLDSRVELVRGDVRDSEDVALAMEGCDAVVHLAAVVSVGESFRQAAEQTDVNCYGTAVVLETLARLDVPRLVLASSMSVYGESCRASEIMHPSPQSVYGETKLYQERLAMTMAEQHGFACAVLRLFNVYGARQALWNESTGVLPAFARHILRGECPIVFEDGGQRRDFVHVSDVARAFRLALSVQGYSPYVRNVGTGVPTTLRDAAIAVAGALGRPDLTPILTGTRRLGDVRACWADARLASEEPIYWRAEIPFSWGVRCLAAYCPTGPGAVV